MCWKCQELDAVIGHYRELSARTGDQLSRKCIRVLIEKLEDNKKAIDHGEE